MRYKVDIQPKVRLDHFLMISEMHLSRLNLEILNLQVKLLIGIIKT